VGTEENGRRWCLGGGRSGGGEGFILDLGRRGMEVGLEGAVRPKGVNGKKREKNDLKNCSRWPKTEYVRMY
jgi:hypothetical protein